jgi:hypothetical protein
VESCIAAVSLFVLQLFAIDACVPIALVTTGFSHSLFVLFLKVSLSCTCYVQGFTPLHLSASQGDLKLVQFLVKFGCSIYCKDKVRTALCSLLFYEASRVCDVA